METKNVKALANIANDALSLRLDLRKSAKRCHWAAAHGTKDHEWRADELRKYIEIAQQLAAAVAVHLPQVANTLKVLSRDCGRVESQQFAAWGSLESELRTVEVAAIGAIYVESSDALSRYMTKAEAARLHNLGSVSNPTAYFDKLIKAGKMKPPVGSGQRWRFQLSDFPESVRQKMI